MCQDERLRFDVNVDLDTAAVLRKLNEEEVRRAASTCIPLFTLSVEDYGLKNILDERNGRDPSQAEVPVGDATYRENEDLLLNRWAVSRLSDARSRMRYSMSTSTATFLLRSTVADLRKIAGSGLSLCRLQVRPQYLWQAGKTRHLGDVQRDSLALSSNTKISL